MRILAIERDLASAGHQNFPDLLRDEAAVVWGLMKRGIIREIWFTTTDRRAVIMLECHDRTEARHHLETLPLLRGGFNDFTLLELAAYDGFERLFAENLTPVPHREEAPPEY